MKELIGSVSDVSSISGEVVGAVSDEGSVSRRGKVGGDNASK
jgi:hypothetical protein